ncbi:TOM1-like protein 9 [Rutidosis leptorrhynchoides]|uniref:TOM1-like protein 9 n=1 Tax=Rutidosis leptorrhynchoides TaxID=125765 RepID=UPI003A9A49B4
MVNSMVGRATSDMLIGPDWALNLEICDICNRDPVQAKDVVKGVKKRLSSKNPKVQLLALTLLETIVKNCGDFVHSYVAERKLLNDMVKIAKKKPDYHVKEKILILIDTWQEAFGGARARYPQYYVAYNELLRLGANFPQRSESAVPVLTPPQTHPLTSYPHNLGNPENGNVAVAAPSAESDLPTLSLTEMQNARGIMDVLAEMLSAIDPGKKEGLKQEVIVDLVEQCRTYKRQVVHLVNSTSDESLLSQGLTLNDDLQRILAKHDSLLSATPVHSEKSKPETSRALVPVVTLVDAGNSKPPESATRSTKEPDLISLAPITTNGPSTTPSTVNVKFDLLSGDDYNSPSASNSLAIVPVGEAQPVTPVSQNNALALVDTFSQNNNNNVRAYSSSPQLQQPQNLSSQQPAFYQNGNTYQNQGTNSAWNSMPQQYQQQPPSSGFGGSTSGGLPPPPWEAQPADISTQYSVPQTPGTFNNQVTRMNMPQQMNNQQAYAPQIPQQPFQGALPQQQMGYMQSQQMAQQMYNNQMQQAYAYGYGFGYGYGQQQNAQYVDQRMSGLSLRDNSYPNSTVYAGPSMANASYVHVPSGKPQKEEDKLFGDLVDFAKVKPMKTIPGRGGSIM